MKNKEKFANEISDIACSGHNIAIDKYGKLCACGSIKCLDCYFNPTNYKALHCDNCYATLQHWANSEYKEKKVFSESDKLYVRAMDKLNWFARDKNGTVYGYVDKPFKNSNVWWDVKAEVGNECAVERVSSYTSATFEPLSWEDEEPTHRSEILGE